MEPRETPPLITYPATLYATHGEATLTAALHVVWGNATIIFHSNGNLSLEGFPTLDAAAQGFWCAVARWAPAGMTVILPEGYGEEPAP